ncbi:hypothetical protein AGMMS49991_06860 [Spirochaetia bacterium]|nr:hypothetical protein AGMMS49991_06860 [Spirochaetia bacterium]
MSSEVFSMDTKAVDLFVNSLKEYPKQMKKYAYRLVNDQAFEFKHQGFDVIESTYTIRDPHFVRNLAFQVEKAATVSSIDQIVARAGTPDETWGKRYKGFTGFYEAIAGTNPPGTRPRNRVITAAGRGGSIYNKAESWARYRRTGGDSGTGTYPSPEAYSYRRKRLKSTMKMTGGLTKLGKLSKKISVSGDGLTASRDTVSFIMMMRHIHYQGLFRLGDSDPRFRKGLYRLNGDKLEQIQLFTDGPVRMPERWDWNAEIVENVMRKFDEQKMWNDYILPAINEVQQMARG